MYYRKWLVRIAGADDKIVPSLNVSENIYRARIRYHYMAWW